MKPHHAYRAISLPFTVQPFGQSDHVPWSSFVQACADATFFHSIEWRDIIENIFEHRTHYLLAERGGEIVGVSPLAHVKSLLFGYSLVSLPFAVYGGAAVTHENARATLHVAAADLAQQLGVTCRSRASTRSGRRSCATSDGACA